MDDEQRNKAHKKKVTGNKAAKKDELRKRRAGIDLQPNRGSNIKAFQGPSTGSHKAQKFFRSIEKRETALHVPTLDKTLKHIVAEPPLLVAVVGPPGVGKTTLIRSMVKFYSGRNLHSVKGPITIVAGRSRRITFLEVPNRLSAMCDAAKVADLMLLMVDGSYGFEMETFECLSIAQVHGFPKMFGVVSHLDQLKSGKALKKRKKFLRHRFWHEVAAGAKLLCLAPMIRGQYRPTDVLHLHRLLICVEPKIQSWRNTHSCVLIDRQEDITDPDKVAENPKMNRTIAFYGYTRGKPMKLNQLVHIPGLGDFAIEHLSHQPDPCQTDQLGEGKSQGHRMRHLSTKHKKLYAPYCDVGGITHDEDAIYIHEDAEKEHIERSGEGLQLLRELQRVQPMDVTKTHLGVLGNGHEGGDGRPQERARRPVIFRDEDALELEMDAVRVPSDADDSDPSASDADYSDNELDTKGNRKGAMPTLADFGLPNHDAEEMADGETMGEGDDGVNEELAAGLAPRLPDDADSIRITAVAHDWSDSHLLRLLKDFCVTGNWKAGEESGDEEGGDEDDNSKGYASEDSDFEAEARGDRPITRPAVGGADNDGDDDDSDAGDGNDEEGAMSEEKVKRVIQELSSSSSGARPANALASVGYKDTRMNAIAATTAYGVDADAFDDGGRYGGTSSRVNNVPSRGGKRLTAAAASARGDDDADNYDILAEKDGEDGDMEERANALGRGGDPALDDLVAGFLNADGRGARSGHGNGGPMPDEDGIAFYRDDAHFEEKARSSANPMRHRSGNRKAEEEAAAAEEAEEAVLGGGKLTEEQERILQKKMDRKKAFDEDYDANGGLVGGGGKSNTYSYYNQLNREVEEKKKKLDEALDEVGDDVQKKIQLVGYFSGLYVRFVIGNIPVEYLQHFDPCQPLLAGGVNAGEDEFRVVHARLKRHRWYPKILKAQDPMLLSIGWRRIQTQPIFAAEDPNGRNRYVKYTPMHMHCLAAFYAPVTPPNTGFLAIPVREQRTSHFRVSCTGYTIGNDVSSGIVKKLKLTGTPAKVEKTNAFIKGMFTSDIEAAKFVGAKLKAVSGVRGILKAVIKGKQGLVRATFEDKIFLSDIVFIRAWKAVDPPRYCSIQRSLLDPDWAGMRTMRELRWDYNIPVPVNTNSEYKEIKRRHRAEDEEEQGNNNGKADVLVSRSTRMQLPYDMKEEFIPLRRTTALQERLQGATTVAPEVHELRRQALLDAFEVKADGMTKKKEQAKKRARARAAKEAEKENEVYLQGLKRAKKETARRSEFRSQHKSRKK